MRRSRGMALVLTLWILAALVILVGAMAMTVRTGVQIARNYGDSERCRWAAFTGVERAKLEVVTLAQQPYLFFEDGVATINSADEEFDLGDASFTVTITDEAGKVNINTASREALAIFFNDEEIADAIVDWRDADDEPGPQGAEDAYYMDLESPYHCKNAPFATVRELLLVKGITEEMLTTAVEGGGTMEELLTIYSSDANTTVDGQTRTNVKTASKEALQTALGEAVTEQDIDAIIRQRGSQTFSHTADIVLVPGLSRDKVKSIYDRLTVSDAKTLPGLININTAPLPVLATVPSLGSDLAQAIVDYREINGAFTDVGQLLDVEAITVEAFAQSADLLTVRSKTFTAVATGEMETVGASSAITCVLGIGETQTAATKYWRE